MKAISSLSWTGGLAVTLAVALSLRLAGQTPLGGSESWLDKPAYGSRAKAFTVLPLTAWKAGLLKNEKTLLRIMIVSGFGCRSILFCPDSTHGVIFYETSHWDEELYTVVMERSRYELPEAARIKIAQLWKKLPLADPRATPPKLDMDDGAFIVSEALHDGAYDVGIHGDGVYGSVSDVMKEMVDTIKGRHKK